jgi:phage shock protein E
MNLQQIMEHPQVTVVDVRTVEEFEMGHYPGAQNMPLHRIPYLMDDIKHMSKPIVFYCRSGNRSGQAVAYLRQHGFESIYNGGGLEEMFLIKQTQ